MIQEIKNEHGYVCGKCKKYIPYCAHSSFKHRCMNSLCWGFYDICKECYQSEIEKQCNYEYLFCSQCNHLAPIKATCVSKDGVLCLVCKEKTKLPVFKNDELLSQINKICEEVCVDSGLNPKEFFKNNFKNLLEDCKYNLNKEIK